METNQSTKIINISFKSNTDIKLKFRRKQSPNEIHQASPSDGINVFVLYIPLIQAYLPLLSGLSS